MIRPMVLTVGVIALVSVVFAVPVPNDAARVTGILVLDNCDPQFRNKEKYEDNLTLVDLQGNKKFRVSGFNNCETIGSSRQIAVDAKRKLIWTAETATPRIRQFDFAGNLTLTIPNVNATALAVDVDSGNIWAIVGRGQIGKNFIAIFDGNGKEIATIGMSAWDIVYNRKEKAIWIADKKLSKIDALKREVLFSLDVAKWCVRSIDVDNMNGGVWVLPALYDVGDGSKNQVMRFDSSGKEIVSITLVDQKAPIRVSVDPNDGNAWVACFRKSIQHYSPDGKLMAEHTVEALAVQADPLDGNAWVVTPTELLKMTRKGEIVQRVAHAGKTSQAWIAAIE